MNEQLELQEFSRMNYVLSRVKKLLEDYPKLRDSDRAVVWEYWKKYDNLTFNTNENSNEWNVPRETIEAVSKDDFVKYATPYNTIERAARRVRHLYPWLKGNAKVELYRESKRNASGKFFKNNIKNT